MSGDRDLRRFWRRANGLVLAVIGGGRIPALAVAEPERTDGNAVVRMRGLALLVAAATLVAQLLSHADGGADAPTAPLGIVIGQALWNAAQAGLLLLLLGLWCARRRAWVAALAVGTLLSLPFAIYAVGPGAWAFTALTLATCALAWTRDAPDLGVAVVDAPARAPPLLAKFEFLALACSLLCSIYNFHQSWGLWPHWNSLFEGAARATGFTPDATAMAQAFYGLGLPDFDLPAYVPVGEPWNSLGVLAFTLIWTVLPFLYVLYFGLLALQAEHTPGRRIQQALCGVAIFHFLFLTDVVDYRFGRGVVNPAAEWCHWLEVFVWRLAIMLPIYQKVVSGQWRRAGKIGLALHYGVGAWAAGFLVYEVLLYNAPMFRDWAAGVPHRQLILFGHGYSETVGWHGALVLMVALYGFMLVALPCRRVVVTPLRSTG